MGITINDWLMMLAVILGPILAVQIQKFLDRRAEKRKKQLSVFRDLMTTRASKLAYPHVSALNMVGLEFNGKKYTKVLNAWTTYLDHLNSYPYEDSEMQKVWVQKRDDQLSDLLYEMGESLGFDFDKVHIKKAGYYPQAYTEQENQQAIIRSELANVLMGNKTIPLSISEMPVDDEFLSLQKELFNMMKEHYEGKRAVTVSVEERG